MRKIKEEIKGITLVALVITIITISRNKYKYNNRKGNTRKSTKKQEKIIQNKCKRKLEIVLGELQTDKYIEKIAIIKMNI